MMTFDPEACTTLLRTRTTWACLVALACILARIFGVEIVPETEQRLVSGLLEIGTMGATILAIWYRAKATKRVTSGGQCPPPGSALVLALTLAASLTLMPACATHTGDGQPSPVQSWCERYLSTSLVALSHVAELTVCVVCPELCAVAQLGQQALAAAIDSYRQTPTDESWAKARALVTQLHATNAACDVRQPPPTESSVTVACQLP